MAITKKLLQFQKLNIVVEKDATNPHFKSSYASLNEVLAKVKKPLNELGVLILQEPQVPMPTNLEGVEASPVAGLRTILVDTEDDTRVECFMPYVGADTAQKLGSANTYCRRYSLVTLLGLEDSDDDGEVASAPSRLGAAKKSVVERNDAPFPTTKLYPEYKGPTAFDEKMEDVKLDSIDTFTLE